MDLHQRAKLWFAVAPISGISFPANQSAERSTAPSTVRHSLLSLRTCVSFQSGSRFRSVVTSPVTSSVFVNLATVDDSMATVLIASWR